MQNDLIGRKVLATTQSWFYGTDGKKYRAIWGTLKSVNEAGKTLGFIPNRAHANWFLVIGGMVVMGCQVLYLIDCPEPPPTGKVKDHYYDGNQVVKNFTRPSEVFIVPDFSDTKKDKPFNE